MSNLLQADSLEKRGDALVNEAHTEAGDAALSGFEILDPEEGP